MDDEEYIRDMISEMLDLMGHTAITVKNGEEAIRAYKEALKSAQPFDVVILDVMMPYVDGFEACQRIREQSDVPIVMLTSRDGTDDIVHGFELGADDYITKPFSVRELKARINTALRRVSPAALQIELGGLLLRPDERQVLLDGQTVSLTAQEFELLHYLAKHAGLLVTRAQLLQDVWGYQSQTDTSRTVDYHIRSLRKKLGDDAANPRFIQTVHGGGYRLIKES